MKTFGPLFRRIDPRSDAMGGRALIPQSVANLVKKVAEAAGLDPEKVAPFSCGCEGSTALANMAPEEEEAYILSVPSEDDDPTMAVGE